MEAEEWGIGMSEPIKKYCKHCRWYGEGECRMNKADLFTEHYIDHKGDPRVRWKNIPLYCQLWEIPDEDVVRRGGFREACTPNKNFNCPLYQQKVTLSWWEQTILGQKVRYEDLTEEQLLKLGITTL